MPKYKVVTTTSLRTVYVVEAPSTWQAREIVDHEKGDLVGFPAGFEDDECVDEIVLIPE